MGTIQSVNMTCTQLTLILGAVLIAPACSTSLATATHKMWSTAGCSGTDTLTADKVEIFEDGTCMETAADGTTIYEKSSCTADTTNGYTRKQYSDSACTTETTSLSTETTGSCVQVDANEYKQLGCGTTSATLGAVKYTKHSAAGCADSTLTDAGYWTVNFCSMDNNDGAWEESTKISIVNGKISYSQWTDSASKDCSGTGTPVGTFEIDACAQMTPASGTLEAVWYKTSAMIDGASVPGYSTLSSGNTATSAAISVSLGVVCTVLNLMFC